MKMNEYQTGALSTMSFSDDKFSDEMRLVLGVCGEAGEVAEKYKKLLRGDDIRSDDIVKELGDVLWYIAVLSNKLGYTLEQVASMNLAKLASRAKRDKIKGDGDHR